MNPGVNCVEAAHTGRFTLTFNWQIYIVGAGLGQTSRCDCCNIKQAKNGEVAGPCVLVVPHIRRGYSMSLTQIYPNSRVVDLVATVTLVSEDDQIGPGGYGAGNP